MAKSEPENFVTGAELDESGLESLLVHASELKAGREEGLGSDLLGGRSIGLVFELPSTRTKVSFEVGVSELGAHPVVMRGDELQLSRGESVADTARVLSRYLHGIVIRSASDESVAELAAEADVPVVNALTPSNHPCQALADLLTLRERFGSLDGLRVAYLGDGNNVARSLAVLGRTAGIEVVASSPEGLELESGICELVGDPEQAVEGADAIYTDVWVSMGDDADAADRRALLEPYALTERLMDLASPEAIALHCLPAHPGEEISAEVLYGPRSAVWDQAENRLHAQKALLAVLVDGR